MKSICCICKEEIELDLNEFIDLEKDTETEYVCDECAELSHDFIVDMQIRKN